MTRYLGAGTVAVACLAIFAAVTPAGAATAAFGPDLAAHAANDVANANCAFGPPGFPLGPFNSPSCMWSHLGTAPDSMVPPASGTVTAVRVKVGATTGRMRVNVIRFLFQQTGDNAHPSTAGPFLEAYGPEFTPTANAVTTVPTSLAVQEDSTPAPADTHTIQVIDALALEVESSTVPIPIFSDPGALTYPVYPGPTAGAVPAPSPNALPTYGTIGYGVLMNADLTTTEAVGAPAPIADPPGRPVVPPRPAVTLPKATIPVRNGVAPITLLCQVVDCSGRVTLAPATGAARAAAGKKATRRRKAVTYGSATFKAKAGAKATVRVRLNATGRALLRRHRSVSVRAKVTFSAGGGVATSFKVTLKR